MLMFNEYLVYSIILYIVANTVYNNTVYSR